MNLLQKLHPARSSGIKAAALPFAPRSGTGTGAALYGAPSFERMSREGYNLNSAVYACISKHAFAYPQPFLEVVNKAGEPQPNHPLQALIDKPNPFMSWSELALYIAIYKTIGGEVFLWKNRVGGRIYELWPYHVGQMMPVSRGSDWITNYAFTSADGEEIGVKREDVMHFRWPGVDTQQPWRGFAPIRAIGREVDSDTEATRYMYALLFNDAAPRTIINLNQPLTETAYQRFIATYYARHGGESRGGIGLLEGEGKISRLALNLQEMDFGRLRDVPETRIASAFGISPMYAGLNVGLQHSTYSNMGDARRAFIEDTIIQLCERDAGELTNELAGEFPGDMRLRFNYSRVVALQENEDAKHTRAIAAFKEGVMTLNESRQYVGLKAVEDLGVPELGSGDVFKNMTAIQPQVFDVTPEQPQLTDGKARGVKARTTRANVIDLLDDDTVIEAAAELVRRTEANAR
jgi:HK97 family phage portal protein